MGWTDDEDKGDHYIEGLRERKEGRNGGGKREKGGESLKERNGGKRT